MSTGDFEAQVRQSVADHLALIATAASAAKGRIVKSVELLQAPAPPPVTGMVDFEEIAEPAARRPAVDFAAEEPAFAEADAFAESASGSSELPEGAISFDDLAVESVDDEGIPVWEDAP